MTSIHHATAKRAEAEDISLALADNDTIVQAKAKDAPAVWHADAKVALAAALLARTLRAEYPAIAFANRQDGDTGADAGWACFDASDGESVWEGDEVPSLAELLDTLQEAGVDLDGAEDEGAPVVVVALVYKQRYADGGHPEHCGDWLAYQLEGAFATSITNAKGKAITGFDTEAFSACLTDNGIELVGKWAALPESGQSGWQGRYRMNGRQKLERQVASCGELVLHGATIAVPEDALEVLRAKHPKAHQPETEAQEG